VSAVLFQLLCIVSMGKKHDLQNWLSINVGLDVAWTNFYESWEKEVVSINKELYEELSILLLNVKVVW
jgi:hypothetical protein